MFLNSRFKITIVFIIPLIITVLAVTLKSATGPFWLGVNSDPSYLYLINSLYLLDHITPIFVDHPGITLQMLGALIIKALSWGVNPQEIANTVFDNPEYYLNAIQAVLLIFYIVSLILVGHYAFRKTKNILFALLIQMPSFLYLTLKSYGGGYVLPVIANVNAGTLLLTLCNLYVMCLIKLYFDTKSRDNIISAILFGIVCALGLATKVPFFPLILVPLILLPKRNPKLIFILTLVSSWVIVTLPIVSRYGKMYAWLKGIMTHTGMHGSGNKGFLEIYGFLNTLLKRLPVENAFLSMAVGVCLVFILYHVLFRFKLWRGSNDFFRKTTGFLSALILVIILQFVMVAKQPAPQYMVPGVSLFGILLALLYWSLPYTARIKNTGVLVFLFLFIGFRTVSAMQYQRKLYEINREIYNFSKDIHEKYKECIIVGYYRSSSPQIAMAFGDNCAEFKAYGKALQEKFPESFFHDRWNHVFHRFQEQTSIAALMRMNKCVLLYGPAMEFPGYIHVKQIESGRKENLYKVVFTTGEEAVKHYLAAKVFEIKKNYTAAYWHAARAKFFGYPKAERYMEELRNLSDRE